MTTAHQFKPTPVMPTIGRIVHAVVPDGQGNLVTRPAIVVRAWQNADEENCPVHINLQVFMDGNGQTVGDYSVNCRWKPDVKHDPTGNAPDSWHWPKREPAPGVNDGDVRTY